MRVMGTVSRFCCSKIIFLHKHHNFDKFVEAASVFKNHHRTSTTAFPSLCVKHRPFSGVLASQDSQVELETLEIKDPETNENIVVEDVKTVRVKFQLQKDCRLGEQFMLVGDDSLLGSWNPERALPLTWSDGHLWTVELDLPVGKTILFKFVLKDVVGRFNWQPGPDRVLQTWDTKNTIVIFGEWENAALQIVMEEEPSSIQTEGPSRNAEMLIVAENLIHQKEDEPAEVDKRIEFFYVDSILSKKQSSETPDESAAAIVADNIATSNKDIKMVKDDLGDSGGATDVMHSPITGSEESLFIHEAEPVLVPGLPPISGHSSKVTSTNEEQSTRTDASLEESEVKSHTVPELDKKHDTDGASHEEETSLVSDTEMDTEAKLDQTPESNDKQMISEDDDRMETEAKLDHTPESKEENDADEEQHSQEPESNKSSIFKNDIKWGRKTLEKLLGGFGLL